MVHCLLAPHARISIHAHAIDSHDGAIATCMWGSLRLAPITHKHAHVCKCTKKQTWHLLEGCNFVLVAEVLDIVAVQGVGARWVAVGSLVPADVGIAVELDLKEFGKRVE